VTRRSTPGSTHTHTKPGNSGRGGTTSTPSPQATSTPTSTPPPLTRMLPLAQAGAARARAKLGSLLPPTCCECGSPTCYKGASLPSRCPTRLLCSSPVPCPSPRRSCHHRDLSRHRCSRPPRVKLPPPFGVLCYRQPPRLHLPNCHRQGHPRRLLRPLFRLLHQGPQPVLSGRRKPLVPSSPRPHSRSTCHSRPSTTLPASR